jgi:hypothetical protein
MSVIFALNSSCRSSPQNSDQSGGSVAGSETFVSWVKKFECYSTNSVPPGGACSRTVLQLSNQGNYRLFIESREKSIDTNAWLPVGNLPDEAHIAQGSFTVSNELVTNGPKVQINMLSLVTLLGVTGTHNDEELANSNQTCGLKNWKLGIFIYFKGPLPADTACQALRQGSVWPALLAAKLTADAQIKAAVVAQNSAPAEPKSLLISALADGMPFLLKGTNQFYEVGESPVDLKKD